MLSNKISVCNPFTYFVRFNEGIDVVIHNKYTITPRGNFVVNAISHKNIYLQRGDGMSVMLAKRRQEAKTRLPELLSEVAFSIKSVHPECTIILFGSFAKGEQHEDSDLDICVLVPELTYRRADMEIDAACAIREDFPLPMDLLLYAQDDFDEKAKKKYLVQHEIKQNGVIIGG